MKNRGKNLKMIWCVELESNESFEAREIQNEFRVFSEKFSDPMVLGFMLYKMSKEREAMNAFLKEILERLESLEKKIAGSEKSSEKKLLLPEADEHIMNFLKKKKKPVCAEEVQEALGYKGANAASARLNMLFKQGILEKQQVGKKVFFSIK